MPSLIEKLAESLGLIPNLHKPQEEAPLDRLQPGTALTHYPPPEQWHDWVYFEWKVC
jgi:hypothetical protein